MNLFIIGCHGNGVYHANSSSLSITLLWLSYKKLTTGANSLRLSLVCSSH